jgi:hypothetical protein
VRVVPCLLLAVLTSAQNKDVYIYSYPQVAAHSFILSFEFLSFFPASILFPSIGEGVQVVVFVRN